jgi:hypothetical protein
VVLSLSWDQQRRAERGFSGGIRGVYGTVAGRGCCQRARDTGPTGASVAGATVAISLQSPRPSDAGKIYALGLSLSTRPAVGTFASGEVLNLAGDTLLAVTAANTLPGIFSGFQDALDVQSRAQARVHIPASVPSRLNLPVHAGGVVLDPAVPGGVTTVLSSNTVVPSTGEVGSNDHSGTSHGCGRVRKPPHHRLVAVLHMLSSLTTRSGES